MSTHKMRDEWEKTFPIQRLGHIFTCDAEKGELRWRVEHSVRHAGRAAGSINHSGYRLINIRLDGHSTKQLRACRIIFAMHHGRWPEGVLFHKNGIPDDDRISNLVESKAVREKYGY